MKPSISFAYSGLNGGSQKTRPPVDGTLFEKRIFVGIIKLKISRADHSNDECP